MRNMQVKKRFYYALGIIFSALFLLAVSYLLTNFLSNNFHTVVPHTVYRSAQLDSDQLQYYIQKYHIKSVLNLEGGSSKYEWYRAELAVSKKMHVAHYDISLGAHQLPTKTQLIAIVNILEQAPKPLLIHCKQGADRSGLVAAMSIILFKNDSTDDVLDQISWQYNVISPTTIGYQVMRNYFSWLKHEHLLDNRINLLRWINSARPLKYDYFGWFLT